MTPALQATVPKVQNGLWYTLRSVLFWIGGTAAVVGIGPLLASLGQCQTNHVLIFKCVIDWNSLSYAVTIGVLIGIGRFVQGYLAPRPPQTGG
jgi:hypothetical protein